MRSYQTIRGGHILVPASSWQLLLCALAQHAASCRVPATAFACAQRVRPQFAAATFLTDDRLISANTLNLLLLADEPPGWAQGHACVKRCDAARPCGGREGRGHAGLRLGGLLHEVTHLQRLPRFLHESHLALAAPAPSTGQVASPAKLALARSQWRVFQWPSGSSLAGSNHAMPLCILPSSTDKSGLGDLSPD